MIAFALTACGGSSGDSGVTPPTNNNPTPPSGGTSNPNTVTLQSSSFSPAQLTVPKGTTVTFQWPTCDSTGGGSYGGYGTACVTHQVVFDDGSNTSSATQDQGSFNRLFDTAGTFKYHCSVHGAAVMSGQITVQ
ncbi:MAG TPA: plastocyanin/azurin family copper-binding protein [Gemmatimonadaceae bacterium]